MALATVLWPRSASSGEHPRSLLGVLPGALWPETRPATGTPQSSAGGAACPHPSLPSAPSLTRRASVGSPAWFPGVLEAVGIHPARA